MKFDVANLVILACAITTTVSGFTPLHTAAAAAAATESRIRLAATVEKPATTTGTKLVPPLSPSEICNEDGRVSSLYDGNVQKTYG